MSAVTVLSPFGLSITSRFVDTGLVVIAAMTTTPDAVCPTCRVRSSHVHSRYLRTVADLPSHGRRVVWRITARRFRCRNDGCPRVVFCERLPDVRPHARATDPLVHAQRDVALAAGGEAGSRLCHRLAFPTSGDTLLRRIRAVPHTAAAAPRVLGVDDFAFRKGHTYGTILVDLERRRVDQHADWIRGRLRDGCSAARVHRELRTRGYTGGVTAVTQCVRRLRAEMGLAPARPSRPLDAEALTPTPPTARRLSVAVVRHPDRRTDEEREWVARLKGLDPEVRIALEGAEEFAALVRQRNGAGLDGWLNRAEAIPTLRAFAAGLRRDEAALRAGLSLLWSNGPVEGQVNRLKLLKRAGYGRAGFDLLRARVLHAD